VHAISKEMAAALNSHVDICAGWRSSDSLIDCLFNDILRKKSNGKSRISLFGLIFRNFFDAFFSRLGNLFRVFLYVRRTLRQILPIIRLITSSPLQIIIDFTASLALPCLIRRLRCLTLAIFQG